MRDTHREHAATAKHDWVAVPSLLRQQRHGQPLELREDVCVVELPAQAEPDEIRVLRGASDGSNIW